MIPWRLSYADRVRDFGSLETGVVFDAAPVVEAEGGSVDDAPLPRRDAIGFGEDFLGGQTITFEASAFGADEGEVRSRLAAFAADWRADALRRTPGAVAELRSHTGRSVFGRPRRFTPDDSSSFDGLVGMTATFVSADARWYGPEESITLQHSPAPSGGMRTPLVAPFSTTPSATAAVSARVTGDLDASPIITVRGPITNPEITIGPLRFAFALSLAWDQTLEIDTRPWASTITRDGASVAGALSPASTWLSEALLPPGVHALGLRGVSSSGTATASVRWRPAFATY